MIKYICTGNFNNNGCGSGETLREAYEDYCENVDDEKVEALLFFECKEVEVEYKLEAKQIPVQKGKG